VACAGLKKKYKNVQFWLFWDSIKRFCPNDGSSEKSSSEPLSLEVFMACCPRLAKFENFKCWQNGTLSKRNSMLMMKTPSNSNVEPLCIVGLRQKSKAKVSKGLKKGFLRVFLTFRSEALHISP
jgi:hypothetical protein